MSCHTTLIFAVLCGAMASYFTRINLDLELRFRHIRSRFWKAVVGGALLGLIIFVFPPLFGEGYYAIKLLLEGKKQLLLTNSPFSNFANNDHILVLYLLAIALLKVVAGNCTSNGGGNGGIFGLSLFTGGLTGYVFAHTINQLGWLEIPLSESNFILVGMAGVFSGVMHAPLTAMFLIAEITNGYELLIPLMIVSTVGYYMAKQYNNHSIFATNLAGKGHWIAHDRDQRVLTSLALQPLIERDFLPIGPHATLGQLIDLIKQSTRNIFPVVDEKNQQLLGVILLDDIREVMFQPDLYDTHEVEEWMHEPPAVIDLTTDDMQRVMDKFEQTGAWNLPVVEQGQYRRFVSKSKIFSAYRHRLIQYSSVN